MLGRVRLAWRLIGKLRRLGRLEADLEAIKLQNGRIWSRMMQVSPPRTLGESAFKVFSQWGEDGIVQRLIQELPLQRRTFLEFGVQDFSEANLRFLMMNDNWAGLVIDGSQENMARLRASPLYWRHDLEALSAFVTRENILEILRESRFGLSFDIISIDIDGNDYHLMEVLADLRPGILICEFNAVLGKDRPITVPYDPAFRRTERHYSNLYFGASIAALAHLGRARGYRLVGVTDNCVNAFFVREDLATPALPELDLDRLELRQTFRESRDEDGRLSYLDFEARQALIRGMPVLDVTTGEVEAF